MSETVYRLLEVENIGRDIYIIARDEEGDKYQIKVEGFRPYFFVREDADMPTESESWHNVEEVEVRDYETSMGIPLKKVFTYKPRHIPQLREEFDRTWEADVPYTRRFLADRDIRDFFTIEQGAVHTGDDEDSASFIRTREDFIHPADIDETEWEGEESYMHLDIETERLDTDDPGIICISALWKGKFYSFGVRYEGEKDSFEQDYSEKEIFGLPWEIHIFDSREVMMSKFAVWLRNQFPDGITGWNLDNFDLPAIHGSLGKFDINSSSLSPLNRGPGWRGSNIPGIMSVDLMKLYKMAQAKETKYEQLNDVADECGFDIPKHIRKEIPRLWREGDLMKIMRYNCYDAKALEVVDEKHNLIDDQRNMMRQNGVDEGDIYQKTSMHDQNILYARREDEILPTADADRHDEDISLKGGKVFDTERGLHEWILTLDLSQIYPAIIYSCSLSYETYYSKETYPETNILELDNKVSYFPSGYSFIQDDDAILNRVVERLFKRDKELKEKIRSAETDEEKELWTKKRESFKRRRNSLFGVTVKPFFRLYRPQIAKTITKIGREILTLAKDVTEDEGYNLVGGDTDSIFVKAPVSSLEKAVEIGKRLQTLINEAINDYAENELDVDEHEFEMEFESVAETMLQTSKKKRYAKKIIWEDGEELDTPDIEIKGFEYKRSSEPQVSRDMQKILFEDLVLEGAHPEEQMSHVSTYYWDVRNGLHPPHYIAFTPKVKKPPSEYKNMPPYVRAMIENPLECLFVIPERVYWVYMQDNFKFSKNPDSLPDYYTDKQQSRIIGRPIKVDTHVLGFKSHTDVPDEYVEQIDYEKMAEKTTLKKVRRIFEAQNISYETVRKNIVNEVV